MSEHGDRPARKWQLVVKGGDFPAVIRLHEGVWKDDPRMALIASKIVGEKEEIVFDGSISKEDARAALASIASDFELYDAPETLVFDESDDDMPRTVKEWAKACHEVSLEKGWWEIPEHFDPEKVPSLAALARLLFAEKMALVMSEGGEAVDAFRTIPKDRSVAEVLYEGEKPVSLDSELADIAIRLFDLTEALGIDIEAAMRRKHAYNKTRPHRHGGKSI